MSDEIIKALEELAEAATQFDARATYQFVIEDPDGVKISVPRGTWEKLRRALDKLERVREGSHE